jgi:uncharacterized protein
MRMPITTGLLLVSSFAAAQPKRPVEVKLPDGVVRYDKPETGASPLFWQYLKDQWGWLISNRPFRKSVAFLVGVGNYQIIRPNLKYVSNDVEEMRQFLMTSAGFDAVYVAYDFADVRLVENYMFNEFPRILTPEDRLLFYFSGHGADLAGTGYMQFAKAEPGKYDPNQYLDVTRTEKWSKQISAKHILFLIDACNSGLGYDAKSDVTPRVDEDLLSLFSGDGSRAVITAGTGNEQSFQVDEGNNQGHSIFTEAFLDAIRYTDSRSGFLILDEVMAQIRRNVGAFSRGAPGRQMTPRLWQIPRKPGTDKGTFVFLNPKAKAPPVPAPLKQYITVTSKDDYSRTRFPAIVIKPGDPALLKQAKTLLNARRFGEALPLLRKSALTGNNEALLYIGAAYRNGWGVAQDNVQAFQWFGKGARAGNTEAMFYLGLMYQRGDGVPQNYTMARQWWEKEAAAGDAVAMSALGVLHQRGDGVPQNYTMARQWWEKAAAAGDAVAMSNLGSLYRNGHGVPQDTTLARQWWEKAAAAGDAAAMLGLGVMYQRGDGVPQNYPMARQWWEKAAAAGDAAAMSNLGSLYSIGHDGVPQDTTLARQWWEKAIAAGYAPAQDLLKSLPDK